MSEKKPDARMYLRANELMRIFNRAVRQAQEESRKLGVPNVYSINDILYWELPDGTLSRVDPYEEKAGEAAPSKSKTGQ